MDERFVRRFRRRVGLDYLQVIDRILRDADLKPGERILDITSEDATLALQMVSKVLPGQIVSVCSTDGILQQAYRQAQIAMLEETIDWRIATIEQLPFPEGTLDAVTCSLTVRLLNNRLFFREAYRLLAPEGRLIMTEALVPRTGVTVWRLAFRRFYYRYLAKNVAESRAEFYSADEIASQLQEIGFKSIMIRGLQKPLTQHSWVFSLIKAIKQ